MKGEEVSSWNERITNWSLMLLYGFAFFMVMKGVFYILGLIQHGICFSSAGRRNIKEDMNYEC